MSNNLSTKGRVVGIKPFDFSQHLNRACAQEIQAIAEKYGISTDELLERAAATFRALEGDHRRQ